MTFEERLEALADRRVALTQSVELLLAESHERRITDLEGGEQ